MINPAAPSSKTAGLFKQTEPPLFAILPKRWVAERTFGWLTRYRRLVRDYEVRIDVSEAMIYAAMINSLVRRIVHP